MSLLARLYVLVLLAVAPAFAVQWHDMLAERREARIQARAAVLERALAAGAELDQVLVAARQLLTTVARARSVQERDLLRCGARLDNLAGSFPAFFGLLVLDPEGNILCRGSTDPAAPGPIPSFGDHPWFREAVASGGFTLGPRVVTPQGTAVIPMALPYRDAAGDLAGVALVGLRIDWLNQHFAGRSLPPDTNLLVADRERTILAISPDPGGNLVGTRLPEAREPQFRAARPGVAEVDSVTGNRRVVGYVPVGAPPSPGLYIAVGQDVRTLYAAADAHAWRDLAILAACAALAVLAAGLLGRQFIRWPVQRLLAAAEAWGAGDLSRRAGLGDRHSEIGRLGAAFDAMAAAAEAREARLQDLARSLEGRVAERTDDLAASEARFRGLFESMSDILFVVRVEPGPRFVYEALNPAAIAVSGYSDAELVGREVGASLPPEQAERMLAPLRQVAASGEPLRTEDEIELLGQRRAMQALYSPMRDEAGRVIRIFGIARDVTEQRATEAALLRSQKLEAVGQLTGGVAHDFNNLLQAVTGNLRLIERAVAAGDRARVERLAGNALRATERGAKLTAQLLSFSRRQSLKPEPVTAERLFADTGELIRRVLGETITLTLRTEPGTHPALADPAQYEAAVLNLAINARDAMPDGGELCIALADAGLDAAAARGLDIQPGDYVRTEVRDTGTGIPAEHLPRIFEPFFTTKPVGKGTGLGLAQVFGFARQSGGTVTVRSSPEAGTCFALYLPRAGDAAIAEQAAARRPAPAEATAATPLVVLLVEDEPAVLEATRSTLAEAGHRVLAVSHALEALAILTSPEPVDVMLTDVVLPGGVNGVELAQEAARLRHGLRILLTSGYGQEVLARFGHTERSAFEVLPKPYDAEAVLARVLA